MKNVIIPVCLLMLNYCFTSCGPNMLDPDEVISEYGPEVINYFYETAFHEDRGGGMDQGGGTTDEAFRWKEDILVSLHGEMLENDSAFVKEAVLEINSIGLPVSMHLVSDPEKSNFQVFFGDAETVAERLMVDSVTAVAIRHAATSGTGHIWNKSSAIEWAKIGILNKTNSQTNSVYASLSRRETILEEMTQALGIIGDSFTYYDSRFFEGTNKATGLSDIDRKVIRLLYDSLVFKGRIMRKTFEKYYGDVLYDRIDPHKLQVLAHDHGLDKYDLDSLKDMLFRSENGDRFIKFPRTAFLKLSGDSTSNDREFCKAFVARFNTITPSFQLEMEENNTIWNAQPALTIHYEEDEKYKGIPNAVVKGFRSINMMFTYYISGGIWIRFYNPEKEAIPDDNAAFFHHLLLTRSLFQALGISTHDRLLVNDPTDSLEIDTKYENYFRFLYDPRFPSGITKAEFDKLLQGIS